MLRFLTAGESHGPCLVAVVEGFPARVPLTEEAINSDLARRQVGYGRGGRMQIERDRVEILAGLANEQTTGAPLAMMVRNRDWANWRDREVPPWTVPRPGHADLAGSAKYGLEDLRLVAERASARETAARVAVGGVARTLLAHLGITVGGYVEAIGQVATGHLGDDLLVLSQAAEGSDVRCPDPTVAARMREAIDSARSEKESLGGLFVLFALGVPVGLGSHVHWDRRLDGLLAQAVLSIPAMKGVEIGPAFENARLPGTQVHDGFAKDEGGKWGRTGNRAGGLEGGVSNGEPIWIRAAMKPIPTTGRSLPSFDVRTGEPQPSPYRRSDVCAVPAASVVGEAVVCWTLACTVVERYGGDTLEQVMEGASRDR